MCRFHPTAAAILASLAILAAAQAADDGRRAVTVEKFGVATRVPQAWTLIEWARDDKAFVLRLPQDEGSSGGYVSCELGLAPEDLREYRQRHQTNDEAERKKPQPARTMLENEIQSLDASRYGEELAKLGQRLVNVWSIPQPNGTTQYECRIRVVNEDTLYTLTLITDEAHFEAYRLDFEEMFTACRFTSPETGLQRMPGGYWMQRDFRFALKLPDGWRPGFGPDDKVLFFATGPTHKVFTDNLLVLATPPRPLDLEALRTAMPDDVAKADPNAKVTCTIVPQGTTTALETLVQTKQGPFEITILERRFQSDKRNYEIKFTCETSAYEEHKKEYRQALDTFLEIAEKPKEAEA